MNISHLENFEQALHGTLANYLIGKNQVDPILPDTTDLEDRWESICTAYLPYGVKEFADYPTASLGWMMFIGMAIAKLWDKDWDKYSQYTNIFSDILLPARGYDEMDEYICADILELTPKEATETSKLVGDTAEMVHNILVHEKFEPGTPDAFNAYVRCLHQLYYYGAAVELRRLGYHMTPIGSLN